MKPEELIGKRVQIGDGTGKVVSIRRGKPPMAVVAHDGHHSASLVRLSEIERLNDFRFEAV